MFIDDYLEKKNNVQTYCSNCAYNILFFISNSELFILYKKEKKIYIYNLTQFHDHVLTFNNWLECKVKKINDDTSL